MRKVEMMFGSEKDDDEIVIKRWDVKRKKKNEDTLRLLSRMSLKTFLLFPSENEGWNRESKNEKIS